MRALTPAPVLRTPPGPPRAKDTASGAIAALSPLIAEDLERETRPNRIAHARRLNIGTGQVF
jgi:putative transposase